MEVLFSNSHPKQSNSMGAFSSTLTSCRQHAKSLLRMSSNSRNNTTSLPSLPQNQQSLSVLAPAKPDQTSIDIITTCDSACTGDNREHIAEQLQPMAIAIVVALLALLANQPTSVHNHIILYKIYLLFYFLSFALTIVPLLFTPITNPTRGVAWLQKQAMKIGIVFIIISVTLRIFLLLPPPIIWYDVLIPLLAVGAISLCLWYGWIKAKNSTQTSSSPAVPIWFPPPPSPSSSLLPSPPLFLVPCSVTTAVPCNGGCGSGGGGCYNCGEQGHMACDCQGGSGGGGYSRGGSSGGGSGSCYNCVEQGHMVCDCQGGSGRGGYSRGGDCGGGSGSCYNCVEQCHMVCDCQGGSGEGGYSRGSGGGGGSGSRYNCGEQGHMACDCQGGSGGGGYSRGGDGGGGSGSCYNCGKQGHMACDCQDGCGSGGYSRGGGGDHSCSTVVREVTLPGTALPNKLTCLPF